MTVALSSGHFESAKSGFDARWRRHALVLGGVWATLLILFARDVGDLATIYWTNTTFGHCLFILPVVGWLVWQRRRELALVRPEGWLPGLALVAVGGFGWLLGEAAEVALARHLGLVLMLQGAVVTVLGPNVARALLFPIAYLLFLVPFGEGMQEPLQDLTAKMVMPLLHLAGVPAVSDGVLITTPNGYFEVAEACSGAKFVIAMLAYGTLVANVCYVAWRRRIAFMAMALIVPILANAVRAFGTIYAAWMTSVEAATGFDHIVYGWFFFALVMAAVLAIGWRWFDRDPDAPWFDPAALQSPVRRRAEAPVAGLLVLAGASLFLALGHVVDARASDLPASMTLPEIPGWERVPLSDRAAWSPHYPTADHTLHGRYRDASGATVDLAVAVYGSQHDGKELVGFGQGAIREDDRWLRVETLRPLDGGFAIRMRAPGPVERETVTWYRVGGVLTGSDSRAKLATLKAKLLGGDQTAVAVLVSAERGDGDSRAALERFVAAAGPVDALADRVASGR
ncbi:exosortase A [Stakelama tenebrarum]|uniref:Exosortase A n=1 Tax=Stakelama tenebrarum TaxID=2711215 RepID=A0A6G6Y7Y3_9SPHN|nr:exosortase A [Sphingosinithalassobacter tenebrarum]QIG80683.1 exosortase A [Sphingosinithalassobacter tenebrarum]